MKKKQIYLYLLFSLFFGYGCKAQLMQTLNDANKIEVNKDYYVGKPLEVLLKDIKPKIISYIPLPDITATKTAGICLLFDMPLRHLNRQQNAGEKKDEYPTTIGVYFADIDAANQIVKNRRGVWTQGLADSLSKLIIKRVYAYGKN